MITATYKMVEQFFDRPAIVNSIDKGERKALSKIGAFVRRRSRSSLRFRKRVSLPGETPSVHSRDKAATFKNILFAFRPETHSVLIGPVGLGDKQGATAPERAEFGGVWEVLEEQWKHTPNAERWFSVAGRLRAMDTRKRYRSRRIEYAARPFMGPALDAEVEAGTIPESYAGTVEA